MKYDRIIVAIDQPSKENSTRLLDRAIILAQHTNSPIHLVYVVPSQTRAAVAMGPNANAVGIGLALEVMDKEVKNECDVFLKHHEAIPNEIKTTSEVHKGDPGKILSSISNPNDLMILGKTEKNAFDRLTAGSVTKDVVAKSKGEIMMV